MSAGSTEVEGSTGWGAGSRGEPAGASGRLLLPARELERLRRRAAEALPREACGVLLGRAAGGERRVLRTVPAENRWPGRPDRYLVDPGTLRRLQDEEADGGPRILGFYHSHPGAETTPSATDRELAWPWYLYLIVPAGERSREEPRAWEYDPEAGTFEERELRVVDGDARSARE